VAELDDLRRREAAMQTRIPRAPEAITFERQYPGTTSQARQVRADLAEAAGQSPLTDDLVLLASELVANAVQHSRSGHSGQTFSVRAVLYAGDYVWAEVIDQGGTWVCDGPGDEHGRGLAIVAAVAGDGNWGIDGDAASRVAWFRLDWPQA
jgi:anti-sigma regulatory factor (Ser/Thr protein kinase)